ncbi:MAG: transglutaminase-like domain-containing protein [Thermoguttaceae bacterium]
MTYTLKPLGVLAVLCAVSLAQAEPVRKGPWPLAKTEGPKVEILAYDNGDVSPWIEFFTFDSPKHPKIVQLRTEYKLDELVKDAKTDIERAAALKKWVAGALKFGTPAPDVFSDWSAVALLARARNGQVVWCGQAAMVFQQACLALGMPARFIELGIPQTPACHFTTEVFLREQGKWAVVDATPLKEYEVYYTVGGVPQSALEMHRHVVDGTMDKVVEVHPDRSHKVAKKDSPAWTFYYVRWLTRCDVVTNAPKYIDLEHVFDKRWHTVEWTDEKTVPWEKQKYSAWYLRNERLAAWDISDPAVVDWQPTDRVKIVLCPGEDKWIFAQLWNGDGEFDHYQVRFDSGGWEDLPKTNTRDWTGRLHGWGLDRCSVEAKPGLHEVQVRVARRDGSAGPESFVKFLVK